MRRSLIALPVAAGLALGAAGLATADDPPRPVNVPSRPATVPQAVVKDFRPGLPIAIHEAGPFGLDREIAEDMASELGLPADRVVAAMRKALGLQFDRRRDEALKCFDDKKSCTVEKVALPRRIPKP